MSTEKLSELSKPVVWEISNPGEGTYFIEHEPQAGDYRRDLIISQLYSQEYVSALLEKSKEKDERAIACVNAFEGIETDRIAGKSLGEFLAGELYLNKAEPKQDGSFGFTFSGLAVQLMADCFADQFKSSGAINYLELLFEHAEVGEMTVTMQRVEGLTPAQKLAAAEQRIAELEEEFAFIMGQNDGMEKELEAKDKRIAELEQVPTIKHMRSVEEALICATDRVSELEAKLDTPVRLPGIEFVKISGIDFPVMRADVVKKEIRRAGFKVEGDE